MALYMAVNACNRTNNWPTDGQSECTADTRLWQGERAGALRVFISSEKTGSNSLLHRLQSMLHDRSAPPLDYRCVIQHGQFNAFTTPLCYRHYLPQGCCQLAPSGSVIHDNVHGFCDSVPQRPCSYVMVLRNPVSRAVSAYNYFCVSCADGNVFCPAQRRPNLPWPGCPNLNLTSYVRLMMAHDDGTAREAHGGLKKWPPLYIDQLARGVRAEHRRSTALRRLKGMDALPLEGFAHARQWQAFVDLLTPGAAGGGARPTDGARRAASPFRQEARRLAALFRSRGGRGRRATDAKGRGAHGQSTQAPPSSRGTENARENNIERVRRGSLAGPRGALRTVGSLAPEERDEVESLLADDLALYHAVLQRAGLCSQAGFGGQNHKRKLNNHGRSHPLWPLSSPRYLNTRCSASKSRYSSVKW